MKFPDLAPLLDNKIILITDMAQLLKLPPIEKGELWGQLREFYDWVWLANFTWVSCYLWLANIIWVSFD